VNVAAVETDPAVVLANPAQVGHMLNIAKAAGMVSANPVLDLGWPAGAGGESRGTSTFTPA
jgi:hypothetical protein